MKKFHLTKDNDQWKLTKEGGERATKTFGGKTKEEATRESAEYLKKLEDAASLKIHKLNGQFEEERTYPRSADPKKSEG